MTLYMDKDEAKIIQKILGYSAAMGYRITVKDEEGVTYIKNIHPHDIKLEDIATTSEDYFYFYKGDAKLGWVRLIYGNGTDLWSDNADNDAMDKMFDDIIRPMW